MLSAELGNCGTTTAPFALAKSSTRANPSAGTFGKPVSFWIGSAYVFSERDGMEANINLFTRSQLKWQIPLYSVTDSLPSILIALPAAVFSPLETDVLAISH